MEVLDLILDALKYILGMVFITSAVVGVLIVTASFIQVVNVAERLLRLITGDDPKRLRVYLIVLATVLSAWGFFLKEPLPLAFGLIALAWAVLHYRYRLGRDDP